MEDTKHSDDRSVPCSSTSEFSGDTPYPSHPERPLAPSDASDARAEDTTATQAPEQGKSVAAEGTPALTSDIHGTPRCVSMLRPHLIYIRPLTFIVPSAQRKRGT